VQFNEGFFEQLGRHPAIAGMCLREANKIYRRVYQAASAHVDTGNYRDGIRVVRADRAGRVCYLVIAEDWKSLILEAKYGILARALKG